jgi:hypothetical protein
VRSAAIGLATLRSGAMRMARSQRGHGVRPCTLQASFRDAGIMGRLQSVARQFRIAWRALPLQTHVSRLVRIVRPLRTRVQLCRAHMCAMRRAARS